MNNYYYRDIKVPFNTLYFIKKDIPTRTENVLNFYEKTIVLLLKEGIKASNVDNLINKLSIMLNIKEIFVKDFINTLIRINAITSDNSTYKLTDQSYFGYSDKDQDILLSNVKEGKDDLEFAYLLDVDSLITRKIIDEAKISYTEKVAKEYPEAYRENIYNSLNKVNDVTINNLVNCSLKNTLIEPIKFKYDDLVNFQLNQINIPITIRYDYVYEKKCGIFDLCEIKNKGSIDISNFISPIKLNSFIKNNYEFDNKKPDFILYLEKLKEEEEKKEKLEKLNQEYLEKERKEQKIKEEMIKKDQEIAEKESVIKQLNSRIKQVSEIDEKEINKLFKQLQDEKEKHQKTKDDLKDLNREHNILANERSIIQKMLKEKLKEIKEEHNKIYKDEFERKIYAFEEYNNTFKEKYPKIYNQNSDISKCLLNMSKKINDKMDMTNDWGSIRNILQNYIRNIFAVLLNRDISTIDRLKTEFSERKPIERFEIVKIISKENLNNLILLEWCADGIYHKNDKNSVDKKNISPDLVVEFKQKLEEFSGLTNEVQKSKLLSLITTITKLNLNETQLKKLEDNL